MKRLLLALILSFLIFINVRLWGVREAALLVADASSGRATCDMSCPEVNKSSNCHGCEGQTRLSRLKACLARAVALKKHKKRVRTGDKIPAAHLFVAKDHSGAVPGYRSVHTMIKDSLAEFIACPAYNELTMQQLIDLMSVELNLLEVLIYPTMGNRLKLISLRKELLEQAVPSVRMVYDKVMSLACHNEILNNQYECQVAQHHHPHLSLNRANKKIFLNTMYQRIADLKKQIKNMQYKLALDQTKSCA